LRPAVAIKITQARIDQFLHIRETGARNEPSEKKPILSRTPSESPGSEEGIREFTSLRYAHVSARDQVVSILGHTPNDSEVTSTMLRADLSSRSILRKCSFFKPNVSRIVNNRRETIKSHRFVSS